MVATLWRIAIGAATLLAVLVINFLLLSFAPGDAADVFAAMSGGASAEQIAAFRLQHGLDQGILVQLVFYLKQMLSGNFGQSLFYGQPVLDLVLRRVPATILLVMPSIVLAVLFGTLLGVFTARRQDSHAGTLVTVLSLIGFAAPVFWTGLVLLIVFASWVPIFPAAGMSSLDDRAPLYLRAIDTLHHLVLPMVTLSLVYLAQYSRQARASMVDVIVSDYIRTARAKGLREGAVYYRHALRNAILPIVTLAGLQFAQVLAGAVLVETVFSWPGLGRMAFDAVLNRDFPLMLGILFFSSVIVVAVNILTDMLYAVLDPRIRR